MPKVESTPQPEQPQPAKQEKEEDSDRSYYSYSYSDEESHNVIREAAAARKAPSSESNIFSSLLKSSKKLFDELSSAGVKSESAPSEKKVIPSQMVVGDAFVTKDKETQKTIRQTNAKDIVDSVEKVDNHLTLLVGMMQEEVAVETVCEG